mmetsp:Transcript_15171/g.31011  ORF Transcript_15171/g.31011 Transcript_15171/m.31011 type:complete len:144 (-) Transcript_15171:269-700(-)
MDGASRNETGERAGTNDGNDKSSPAASDDEKKRGVVGAPSPKAPPPTPPPKPSNGKVKVHFVAVGSAPLMKKTKFQVGADQRFSFVITFLRRMLKLAGTGDSLFLYINSAFVPAPDELVGDLNECFSVRGELVIHYSLQEAWG